MNRAAKRRQQKLADKAAKKEARKKGAASALSRQQAQAVKQSLDHAVQLHNAGDLAGAESLYRQILQAEPNQPIALHLLGVIAHQVGRNDIAEQWISKAIEIHPGYAEAHNNLGATLRDLGRLDEAIAHYETAIGIQPEIPNAHYNLGNALRDLGRADEALSCYQKAIDINADYAEAHSNLGLILHQLGRFDEAISRYRNAIDIKSDYAEAHSNLGNTLNHLGRLGEAAAHHRTAIDIKPDFAEGAFGLGITLAASGQIDEAIAHFRKAIESKPDYTDAHSNLLLTMHYGDCAKEDLLSAHRAWKGPQAANLLAQICRHDIDAEPKERLNIGFVSGDFRKHSVSYFLKSFFAARNEQGLAFYCYSNVHADQEDAVTQDLREIVDGWRTIAHLNDEAATECILADKIDILVDLSGHTKGNRLPLFARKAAPIQVTWLGYPDTTGLAAIDYRISDDIADPSCSSDKYCVEKLVRLPDGFLCYEPLEDTPDVTPLPMRSNANVVFVSFNNLSKVTPDVVEVWSRILKAVPGSELLMKSKSFSCPDVRRRYQALFEEHAIGVERLRLLQRSPSTYDHLALYGKADIGLDSFPYNGTTTTCEALWMGVPVVTLCGDRHSARVGASILTQIGLENLIAENADDYVEKAVSLANDPDRLEPLRSDLRTRVQKSSLCDAETFASNMETAFRSMWDRRRQAAAAISVDPVKSDDYRVLVPGMPRSASTWLYNAARLLLSHHVGSDFSCGWIEDITKIPPRRHMLIKAHKYDPATVDWSTRILYSYRDIRDVIASMSRKFGLEPSMEFADRLVLNHEQWAKTADFMMPYDAMLADKESVVADLAELLSVDASCAGEVVREIAGLSYESEGPKNEKYNEFNLFHQGHITDGRMKSWDGDVAADLIRRVEDKHRDWFERWGFPIERT